MRRLILDSNMLLLFVVGRVDPMLLGVAKRVKEYSPGDFDTVRGFIAQFGDVVLLPNILTETSNLLDHLKGDKRDTCMDVLGKLARFERYVPSLEAARRPEYVSLGLTDAAILRALDDESTYLLTADRGLHVAALYRGAADRSRLFAEL